MPERETAQDSPVAVLVVEDQPDDAKLVLMRLARQEELPVTASHVPTLAQALEVLRRQRVDAVLLDLNLGDSQGLSTVRAILDAAPRTPVIILSGCDDVDVARQAVHEGAQDFLSKVSLDKSLLARAIRYAIERDRHRQGLAEALEVTRREIAARVEVEEDLREMAAALTTKANQLHAANETLTDFLADGDWRRSSQRMLDRAVRLTQSVYGIVGIVTSGSTLRLLGFQPPATLAPEAREPVAVIVKGLQERGYWDVSLDHKVFRRSLDSRMPAIVQGDGSMSLISGAPDVHLPITVAAVIPIVQREEVTGLLAVANRPETYGSNELHTLITLASVAGVIHESYRRREEQRALAEKLRHVERLEAVTRFASRLAQEFNNVLTNVLGYSKLLCDTVPRESPVWNDVQAMRGSTEQAVAIARQLMAISERQVVKPQVVDLNEVIGRLKESLELLVPQGSTLALTLDTTPTTTLIDQDQIEQIVVELMHNARDALAEPGVITISTRSIEIAAGRVPEQADLSPGAHVVLSVTDTGVGMDEETRRRVFEPLFTIRGSVATRGGVGLAGVYRFVRQMGGAIVVNSSPGKGTRLDVYLRRFETPVRPGDEPTRPAARRESRTILLVEDEPVVLEVMGRVLGAEGFKVLRARDGGEALSIMAGHAAPIDMLVTDLAMPGMQGNELAKCFKQSHPDTPVLFISGVAEAVLLLGAEESQIPLLRKPFAGDTLVRTVVDLLAGARMA